MAGTGRTEISKTDTSFIYSTFRTWHIGTLMSLLRLNTGLSTALKKPQMTWMLSIRRIKWALRYCSF